MDRGRSKDTTVVCEELYGLIHSDVFLGGKCRCTKHYDGLKDGLLNVNDHYLLSHCLLLQFFSQFMEGKLISKWCAVNVRDARVHECS